MANSEISDFSDDKIKEILKKNQETLVNLNIGLDRHEISNSLTSSLNLLLLGNKTSLIDVYEVMISNFENVSKRVEVIESQIKAFNEKENNSYVIDPDNILYIVFYKQIVYIRKLVQDIYMLISSKNNLVYIYAYLISMLYNEPMKITSNYIFILNNIVNNPKFTTESDTKLKEFLNPKIIDKIYLMIKIIYDSDKEFGKLLADIKNQKLEEYRKNNGVDLSDSFKEIESQAKSIDKITGGDLNIYDLESKFIKKRNYLLSKKRDIVIANLYNPDNLNLILMDNISIELWFGYNLFVYKRFNFNFDEYANKVNEIIQSSELGDFYILKLDHLKDIDTPFAAIVENSLNMTGGFNFMNDKYYKKYLKYKNKYLQLRNKL